MILWIGAVSGFRGTKQSTVAVLEVYLAAVIARARRLWSLSPSGVNTDAVLLLSSVRVIWMLWKVESKVP